MITQIEKINAFVDSIANRQLNEKQESLLLNSISEQDMGGKYDNGKDCSNGSCQSLSNGGNCENTTDCKFSYNKGNCTRPVGINSCNGMNNPCSITANPCYVVGPPVTANYCI